MKYQTYITSNEWRQNHLLWLKKANHHCSMFPFLPVGNYRGKYYRYHIHHTHYRNMGNERYWIDVLALSPFAHDIIIHGVLSGFKRPSKQKHYPNFPQRIAHLWCRLPSFLKLALIFGILLLILRIVR